MICFKKIQMDLSNATNKEGKCANLSLEGNRAIKGSATIKAIERVSLKSKNAFQVTTQMKLILSFSHKNQTKIKPMKTGTKPINQFLSKRKSTMSKLKS